MLNSNQQIALFYICLGRGVHVLQSGHDKIIGDSLILEKTRQSIGSVELVLLGNSVDRTFRDIALTELPSAGNLFEPSNVITGPEYNYRLSRHIRAPEENAEVMKFSETLEKGMVYYTCFNCCNSENAYMKNCVTAILFTGVHGGSRRSFQVDAESGTLAIIKGQSTSDEVHAEVSRWSERLRWM